MKSRVRQRDDGNTGVKKWACSFFHLGILLGRLQNLRVLPAVISCVASFNPRRGPWNDNLRLANSDGGAVQTTGRCGETLEPLALLVIFFENYQNSLQAFSQRIDPWKPDKLVEASRKLGTWGFLTYSYFLEKEEKGVFFSSGDNFKPPNNYDIEKAVNSFVDLSDSFK